MDISAPMIQVKALPMRILLDNGLPKENMLPGAYMAGVLKALIQISGQETTVELWKTSRLSITDFVAEDNVQEFMKSANVSINVNALPSKWFLSESRKNQI